MALTLWSGPHSIVAVLATVAVLASRRGMVRLWPATPSVRTLVRTCCGQFRQDVRTNSRRSQWLGALGWGVLLVGNHAIWLVTESYTKFEWLDLAAHMMGGAGVGALLFLGLRERVPNRVTTLWLALLTLAVGAGFELYEFLFRSFWHHWSLQYYVTDTLVDLALDGAGAAVVVAALQRADRATTVSQ